jgi:CubicO group peptidase (beta-lactamase class C family)
LKISIVKTVLIVLLFSILNTGCGKDFSEQVPYMPPEHINDGLEVGTLEEVSIDTQMILKASSRIHQGKYREVHSMLIYKDGKLVFEEYYRGHKYQWDAPAYHGELVQWDRDMMHAVMSTAKSFTSACIGIAIDRGFIESVHESIFEYLPDYQHLNTGGKDRITIEHLLTMTSGLQWDEWGAPHGTSANDIDRLYLDCEDPVICVLEKPLVDEPGEEFTYHGGGIIVLGEIVKNASGMNIDDFSMEYLFTPLGVDSTSWYQFGNGMFGCEGSLYLKPRDMLKFGAMYLNEGTWNGEQIIPKDWVDKSSVPYKNNRGIRIPIDDTGKNGYGYTWWTNHLAYKGKKTPMYSATGWGGQEITVIPEKNMVLVFTGGNYAWKKTLHEIMKRYIIPAID